MRVTAKADYAVRAAVELAHAFDEGRPVKGERLAEAQNIPLNFLENILGDLRQSGVVRSQRGPEGGYWLARDPKEIAVADVMRAVEGPLAAVRGEPPEALEYKGAAEALQRVWIALRTNIRGVLEEVTLADIARDELPARIGALAEEPDSWKTRRG
jgi:Rrf2 family protein